MKQNGSSNPLLAAAAQTAARRKARIAAAGTSGVRLLQLLGEMSPADQGLAIAAMSDDQLDAIVSTPDPSGIDVRQLTDAQLEAIIDGE